MIAIYLTEDARRNPNHEFLIGDDDKPLSFKTFKDALWYLVNRNFTLDDLLALDFRIDPAEGETQMYGHWVHCIGYECPESGGGKCRMGTVAVDYPADGKCLYPDYVEYDKELEAQGVFQKIGEVEP